MNWLPLGNGIMSRCQHNNAALRIATGAAGKVITPLGADFGLIAAMAIKPDGKLDEPLFLNSSINYLLDQVKTAPDDQCIRGGFVLCSIVLLGGYTAVGQDL